jgi:C1A family cysteine protease
MVKKLPTSVDLRTDCSPVYDQGSLGSCTANAGVSMMEYFQKHATGKYTPLSRLFLYKATRNIGQRIGDTGAWLRETLGAIVLLGIVPDMYWPYDISKFDREPSIMGVQETTAFVYSVADDYTALRYIRLDPAGTTKSTVITNIKMCVASYMPPMFGFDVYQSIYEADLEGNIPYPGSNEQIIGGHAVLCCGYDDAHTNRGTSTKGAFLIKNSWNTDWGKGGYGRLPYEYVIQNHADDWWTVQSAKWVDSGKFL